MNQDVLFFIYSDEKNLPTTSSSSLHVELDGTQFPTLNKLYIKLNKELLFGGDFGNNLDALFDSMTDLSWLKEKKFRIIFKNSEELLKDEDEDTIFDFLSASEVVTDFVRVFKFNSLTIAEEITEIGEHIVSTANLQRLVFSFFGISESGAGINSGPYRWPKP